MAATQPTYVVHPSGSVSAADLASLYGLSISDYITGPVASQTWHRYIHLYVRDDNQYRNIKQELGNEDGTAFYNDRMVDRKTNRLNNYRRHKLY